MNTSKSLMVLGSLVLMLVGGISSSSAQTDRQSKASLRDNAIRDARKEAKSYEKQGYATMVGRLPMDKQIEAAWIAQTKRNEGGEPAFYIATAKAVGGSYGAAKLQADNHAKLDIAGQVGAALAQIIESKVVNNDMGEGDVETLNNMISASKAVKKALNILSNFFRFNNWRIAFHHLPFLVNEKFGEIPFDTLTT